MGCGFHKPHLPWVAPRKYFDMYSLDQIKLPHTPPDDRDDIPPIALTHQASDDKLTDDQRRQMILAYHATTTFMDAQLGLVLDSLDRNKLWDSTVVVLFGDHGWHLYDHLQLWRKMTVFEPFGARAFDSPHAGRQNGYGLPAAGGICGFVSDAHRPLRLAAGAGHRGLSFAPLLKNPQMQWKKAAYTMVLRQKDKFGHSVVTERYRYTEWDGGKEGVEFYDHETDPNEWTNLAWASRTRDAKTSARLEEMRKLLHADQLANAR